MLSFTWEFAALRKKVTIFKNYMASPFRNEILMLWKLEAR